MDLFIYDRPIDYQNGDQNSDSNDTDSEEQVVGFATNILAADEHFQFAFLTIGA